MTSSLAPGSILAQKYRVDSVLGSGGMATVLAATHLHLREPVAIKVLHRQVLTKPGAFDRFVREARVAMRLRSEHVARVFDIGTDEGTPFIVMELLRGADLAQHLRQSGPLAPSEAVDYLLQACEALAEAHAAGVVHRDLKPANLFLCEAVDGRPLVKVLDFGVSKLLVEGEANALAETAAATASDEEPPGAAGIEQGAAPASVTVTRAFLGSPQYMAPEQIRSARGVDARADVWALGVVLYELASGAPPFRSETLGGLSAAILEGEPAPLVGPQGPLRELDAAIAPCFAKDPARRFADVRAFAEAVVAFASDDGRASFDRVVRTTEAGRRSGSRASLPAPPPRGGGSGPGSGSGGSSGAARAAAKGARPSARTALGVAGVALLVAASASLAMRRGAASAPSPAASAAPRGCSSHRACSEAHGGAPWACRTSDGACVPMASEDCEPLFEPRDLTSDDTLWIGAMFPTRGPQAEAFGKMNREGVDLARKEIAQATASLEGGQRVPPIALVACDDSTDAARAARHLVDDVGVPAIVGFRSGQEVIDLAGSLLIPRGVMAVSSLTSNPLITRLPQPPGPRLVWRTTFSLEAVADAAAGMIHDALEPRLARGAKARIALARQDLPSGLCFAERFYSRLVFNGKPALDNGHDYLELLFPPEASAPDVARVAEGLAAHRPTLIVLLGDSSVTVPLVRATEAGWPAGAPRPTYLAANNSTADFAEWLGANVDRRRRLLSIESVSNSTENARFVIRYNQSHASKVTRTINPGVSYDAIYLLANAAFAARGRTDGATLARAVARLVPPGRQVTTGPTQIFEGISALAAGESIDLQGTANSLDFDLATGEAPSDFALLCPNVDAAGRSVGEDVESGVVFRAKDLHIVGAMRCP